MAAVTICSDFGAPQNKVSHCFHCFPIYLPRSDRTFSKPGFNNTWTMKFQMFKLDLEKAEEPEIKLPTSAGSSKEQKSSRKTSTSALSNMPKPLTVWITTNCGKFWKRWEYQTTWPASWEICMQVRKQQLELDMEQETGSKSEKERVKPVYCHPAYLTYMQSTSWETQICRWHHPYGRKWRETKEPLDESERVKKLA